MESILLQGETLFINGDLEAAEDCFMSCLQNNARDADALNNLGAVHFSRGDRKKAEEYFSKALAVKADYADAFLNLIALYQHEQRWQEAALQIETCLGFGIQDERLLNQLAWVYLEMNEIPKAISVLKSSLTDNTVNKSFKDTKTLPDIQNTAPPKGNSPNDKVTVDPIQTSETPIGQCPRINRSRNVFAVSKTSSVPLVSVGLPVYNGGALLKEAIESILSQEFKEFELILSDNCSRDESREVCEKYARIEKRVRLVRQPRNVGARRNFLQVLGLAQAPYFMWASHDDLREKTFIGECLEKIQSDSGIALVYPQTQMLDANGYFLGIAEDFVRADHESPVERFRHLIWEIGQCNMLYGLFRSDAVKNVKAWGQTLFGDNLLLAEIALIGKIVQIPKPLFIRRFTRDYNYPSPDERNVQLMACIDPDLFEQGISLPHCRFAYAHLDLVNRWPLETHEKASLFREVLHCFRTRFGNHMQYEIDRVASLISRDIYFWDWRNDHQKSSRIANSPVVKQYHVSNLLKTVQEALLIYPKRTDLLKIYRKCFQEFLAHVQC